MSNARELIRELVAQAEAKIAEAERIADESGEGFGLDIGGYGMGGYYEPKPKQPEDWNESDGEWEASGWEGEHYGWMASSQSC